MHFECQVSSLINKRTNDEVVDHLCNLAYTSKKGKWEVSDIITHVILNTINDVV